MKKILSLFIVAILIVYGCKKIDYGSGVVKTAVLTMSAPGNASFEGPVISCTSTLDLSSGEFTYGFCYATTRNPVIPGINTTSTNYAAGSFSARLVNIEYGETYYVRAFVTNGLVTTYSTNTDSFFVPGYIYTDTVKNISARTFDVKLYTLPDIADSITERGVCYDTLINPTINGLKTTSTINDTGVISIHVNDTLFTAKKYYLRSYFMANGRPVYGNQVSFTTAGYKGVYGYIIFDKVDTTNGWRYVEAAPDTITVANIKWGCAGTDISTQTGIGSGYENSIAITSACTDTFAAAYIATHIKLKAKTDWYLPSVDELKALYETKLDTITGRPVPLYSSTQASASNCFIIDFSDGSQQQIIKSSGAAFIWPVRRYK